MHFTYAYTGMQSQLGMCVHMHKYADTHIQPCTHTNTRKCAHKHFTYTNTLKKMQTDDQTDRYTHKI